MELWLWVGFLTGVSYNLLTLTEMIWLKCLYIYRYSFVASFNEYHVAWSLEIFNALTAGLLALVAVFIEQTEAPEDSIKYGSLLGRH